MKRLQQSLFDATAGEFRFGIGVYREDDRQRPVIILHYLEWPRSLLDLVAESLAGGLDLTINPQPDGRVEIYLASRSRVTVTMTADGETDALEGPAWDARLGGVDASVAGSFEEDRQAASTWLLVVRGRREQLALEVDRAGLVRSCPTPSLTG